ncbi:MAG: hypothetical protein FD167_354 [bacterium]|nr:MAG: hypothetical protein FD167_354 [bacterium]
MKRVKDDFDKRKDELNKYFDFLSKLDKDKPTLHYSEKGVPDTHSVDSELEKILKANGFLLIYNLVESFCRNFIIEILTEIQGNNLTLEKLSEKAQKIWIGQKVKNNEDNKTSSKKLENLFYDMATHIFNNTVIEFSEIIKKIETEERFDAFGLSGSINADKIRKLALMYGFHHITPPKAEKAGEDLDQIKDFRNKLAHGRITFADCGKDKSVIDMIKYKNNAIEYLEGVLLNIEEYIKKRAFKK